MPSLRVFKCVRVSEYLTEETILAVCVAGFRRIDSSTQHNFQAVHRLVAFSISELAVGCVDCVCLKVVPP